MRPVVISSFNPKLSSPSKSSLVMAEQQILTDKILIPGSNLHLTYSSTSAPGFLSTLLIRLTPPGPIPDTLSKVHLSVKVAGRIFKKVFEADSGLEYVYAWDKQNVYNQKVHGVVHGVVAVGYQYRSSNCDESPIWETRSVTLKGFDVDISYIGKGWNLDIHHHYNPFQGRMMFRIAIIF